MRTLACICTLLLLSGCTWFARQADAIGSIMPVIGDRCEHWQCITTEGQQKSEAIREMQEKAEETPEEDTAADPRPPQMPREPEAIAPDSSASRSAPPSPGNSERKPFPNPSPVVP